MALPARWTESFIECILSPRSTAGGTRVLGRARPAHNPLSVLKANGYEGKGEELSHRSVLLPVIRLG